jgi:glycine betaine/proline transport system substrate-binding protein
MSRIGVRRWLVLSMAAMLIVAGCARGSGATPVPPAATTAPAASVAAPASADPGTSAAPSAPSEPVAATCTGSGDKGTVQMMINQWIGAAANVAVAQCLLQQMGYTVKTNTLAEEVAWQGFETGEVDVILENWGHPELEQQYITDTKLATDAGPMGVQGIIGWYVPAWMVEQYPDITDWNSLNKYAEMFKTSESGDKGQFLGADPTFVQYDEALIANLGLNYKVVFSGSEAGESEAAKRPGGHRRPAVEWRDPPVGRPPRGDT